MKATPFGLTRGLCLLVVSVTLFFSQGCTKSQTTPSPTQILPPTPTNPPQEAKPTITAIIPTATIPAPTSTPFSAKNPVEALARLNFGSVEQIVLSPGGDALVGAGATHICLYDTASYEQVWCTAASLPSEHEKWGPPEPYYESMIRSIAFRPDGSQIVYALWYGAIVFLDSTTGQRLNLIDGYPQNSINQLVWSKDNKHLILWSSENGVDTWNMVTGDKEGHLEIDPTKITSATWTPDGNKAAFSLEGEGSISLWDMPTLKQTGSFDTELPEYGFSLALSPDGTILYASVFDKMGNCGADLGDKAWLKAWNLTTSELIFDVDMHGKCMRKMFISPDGHWLGAITGYGKLFIFDAYTGSIEVDLPNSNYIALTWWGNDRILCVHYPASPYGTQDLKSIGELDIHTKEMTSILLPGFETIYSLAWLPDSDRLVTNSGGDTISIWDATTGQRLEQFQITSGGVSLTNFDPASISPVDGTLAIPAQGSVATVDLETRQVLKIMEYEAVRPETHAVKTSWSGDGKRLAGEVSDSGDTNIIVWDAPTGKLIINLPFEIPVHILSMALSPDGTMLALSEWPPGEYRLVIWDIEANMEIASIKTPCSTYEISWINQNQVAVTNIGSIEIYDITTGNQVRTLAEGHTFAVSPDRSLVAVEILREGISISDFNSGKELAKLNLEPSFLDGLAISPDGKLLAALTEFGSVLIWDISGYYRQ